MASVMFEPICSAHIVRAMTQATVHPKILSATLIFMVDRDVVTLNQPGDGLLPDVYMAVDLLETCRIGHPRYHLCHDCDHLPSP